MVASFCPPTAAQIVRGRRRLELCASAGLATEFVTPRVDHGYIGAKRAPPLAPLRASIAVCRCAPVTKSHDCAGAVAKRRGRPHPALADSLTELAKHALFRDGWGSSPARLSWHTSCSRAPPSGGREDDESWSWDGGKTGTDFDAAVGEKRRTRHHRSRLDT